jgi:hypothetical protein
MYYPADFGVNHHVYMYYPAGFNINPHIPLLGNAAGSFKPLTLDGGIHGGERGISRHSFCKNEYSLHKFRNSLISSHTLLA